MPALSMSLALLAGYTLENILKAYLCRAGGTEGLKREEEIVHDAALRHNLSNLWTTVTEPGGYKLVPLARGSRAARQCIPAGPAAL